MWAPGDKAASDARLEALEQCPMVLEAANADARAQGDTASHNYHWVMHNIASVRRSLGLGSPAVLLMCPGGAWWPRGFGLRPSTDIPGEHPTMPGHDPPRLPLQTRTHRGAGHDV